MQNLTNEIESAEQGPQRQILNTTQAAARIGCCNSTLEKYRVSGGGPKYFKIGKAVRYGDDHIDSWLEARLRQSTSEEAA